MLLKYAPKRMSFEFEYYSDRMMLAAIDHNIHLFRENAKSKAGEQLYIKKYSKRSKKWHAQPVKKPKTYPHLRVLLSNILKKRISHHNALSKSLSPPSRGKDLKLLSPTIGGCPPPTKELVANHKSRVKKNL